jgi:hypothetical protein
MTAASGHASWLALASVITVVLLISTGCGGQVRRAVAGTVTLDGQPLDQAVVQFVPLDAGGRKTGAPIAAGRYAVPQDVGLLPGRYRVEIADDPPIDPTMRPDQVRQQARRRLPVSYSTSSPLTVEVAANGSPDFDFELASKPAATP